MLSPGQSGDRLMMIRKYRIHQGENIMGQIAVIGPADPSEEEYETARRVGCLIATDHETLVCGGLSGVMEAACKGAREKGGLTIGIVP